MSKKNQMDTEVVETVQTEGNRVLTFHSLHPKANPNRASYTIAGRPGNLVIFLSLFADGVAPPTLTLDSLMVTPQVKMGAPEKEAAKLAKQLERAQKAEARIAAATAKAEERKKKAEEALAKARATVAAATGSTDAAQA